MLHVNVEKFPWFPPFSRLKHLILSFDKDTGNVFEYLPNSEVLETLSLEVSDAVFEAPALQLESLRCLRAVALDGIRPASIRLPNSCSLHLINLEVADMATAHWDSVLLKVRTFQLQQLLLKVPNMLPNNFAKLQNVTTVKLMVSGLGTPEAYLSVEGLSHVQRLFLGGEAVYIKVPAKVSWHEVMFSTTGTLGLLFMDPKRFAKDVANVCAMYSLLAGPSLLDVIRCWAAQNRPWSSRQNGSHGQTAVCCKVHNPIDFSRCCCGVCMPCLGLSGIAHKLRKDPDIHSDSESDLEDD